MRIIAGQFRGLHLKTLKGDRLRPTTDQMRETLFDVLGNIEGKSFLDAYAGSGAVGLEALSRGARPVALIESHRPAAALIRENLQRLHVESGFQVLQSAFSAGLVKLAQAGTRFAYVFLDPPYSEIAEYHRSLRELGRSSLLLPDARVIVEHSRYCLLEPRYGALIQTRLLRHGDSQLAFYRPESPWAAHGEISPVARATRP